jgi:hypothetical protein
MTDRWLEVANETLIEVHRSDEFVEAQRRMLRSASDYRLQERKRQLRALQRDKGAALPPPSEAVPAEAAPSAARKKRGSRAPAADAAAKKTRRTTRA